MREIKFRAWDKDNEKMVYIPGVKRTEDWLSPEINELIKHCQEEENYILMQYTGLKDKNGKEIYEGDILDFQNANMKKPTLLGYVKYHVERACYTVGVYFDAYGLPLCDECDNGICDAKNLKVIGNIYENPELLEHNG